MKKGLQNGLKCILRDIDLEKNEGAPPEPPPMNGGSSPSHTLPRSWLAPLVNNPSGSSPARGGRTYPMAGQVQPS